MNEFLKEYDETVFMRIHFLRKILKNSYYFFIQKVKEAMTET